MRRIRFEGGPADGVTRVYEDLHFPVAGELPPGDMEQRVTYRNSGRVVDTYEIWIPTEDE